MNRLDKTMISVGIVRDVYIQVLNAMAIGLTLLVSPLIFRLYRPENRVCVAVYLIAAVISLVALLCTFSSTKPSAGWACMAILNLTVVVTLHPFGQRFQNTMGHRSFDF